ncbi:MAG: PP2C family protein-serine/threonine phosphatase, partial [Ktedonobacteraceae bacterium]
DFQKIAQITPANTDFQAATAFAGFAQACAQPKAARPSPQVLANSSSLLLMIILIVGLVVLLLALVLVTLWVGRGRKHRRELAQFAAEQTEALRLAEVEHQRQTSTHTREIPCPNCHQPVYVSDAMCRNCRYPLSPSASGLNVRLGSGPLPVSYGATQAPPPPSATSMSDMPTIQLPPNFAVNKAAASNERTIKRQKVPQPQETVYHVPHSATSVRNLNLAVGTLSDPGLKRKHKPNEDSLFAIQGVRTHDSQPQRFGLFVVADGMGGHANGQDASRTAIQTIIGYMLPRISGNEAMIDDEAFKKLLSDGVQNANLAVHNRNLEVHADMGTTMTAALVVGATAYVANVGDSRTYRYTQDHGLSKVSMDHSVVASLVEAGIIQPDDIYTHPKRNQIYRSLGEKSVVEVDTFKVDVQPGDKLLLCSDGLWDMVRDPLIQEVMSKPANDPNKTGQELIRAALQGGGEDNVTVIVVQFSELNTSTGMTGVQLHAIPETVTLPPNLPPM